MKDKIATAKTLIERLRGFHQVVYEMKDRLGINRLTLLPSLDVYESLRAALRGSKRDRMSRRNTSPVCARYSRRTAGGNVA